MEIKNTYYYVEWMGETPWGDCFSDRKRFENENEALSFILHDLKNDSRVYQAFYTTHKTIEFERGK